jgi:hypothetical protein
LYCISQKNFELETHDKMMGKITIRHHAPEIYKRRIIVGDRS